MEKLIYGATDVYYVGLEEEDKCPNCGGELRAIPFFAGDVSCEHKKLERSVMDDKKITTETYGNWVKCWGGYCSHCAESFHNNSDRLKMNALNSLKKLCIFLFISIASYLALVLTEIKLFQLPLFIGLFGVFPFTLMTLGDLGSYLSRKPYVEPTAEELEDNIISACNGRMNREMVRGMLGKDMFFKPEDVLIEESSEEESSQE
ncbi:MAG: hypothetical protein K5871_01315 [Lachnospiraceae bacterium]|nr:hypothetical protein [Lachnospiraceae bacterium]